MIEHNIDRIFAGRATQARQDQPYTCGQCGARHADLSEHCGCQPGPTLKIPDRPGHDLQRAALDHLDNADAALEQLGATIRDQDGLRSLVKWHTIIRCRASLELVRETVDGLVVD